MSNNILYLFANVISRRIGVMSIKIAIVEDDHPIAQMYKFKLEAAGFTAMIADNGKQGLELAEKHLPDLILLDIRMPVMSGDKMLQLMRQTDWGSKIRVIILTNISRDEAPKSLNLLNVDRYIVKAHHTPAQILDIVSDTLKHSRS